MTDPKPIVLFPRGACTPKEPTADQCTKEAPVDWGDGRRRWACWYPQMGGYVGRAVVMPHENGCFDVWVWHDGEFPFGAEGRPDAKPAELHHCMARQFIEFGKFVRTISRKVPTG